MRSRREDHHEANRLAHELGSGAACRRSACGGTGASGQTRGGRRLLQAGEEGKGTGSRSRQKCGPPARPVRAGERYFDDQRRVVIRDYYGAQFQAGRCPPGLAKKRNGCTPPGQAKKWQVGRPLPRDVVFYDLPPTVVAQIGPAPAGHRFVRVAADILLIAVGTGMVIDAIEDLGRM
jgi:hypothetical protein